MSSVAKGIGGVFKKIGGAVKSIVSGIGKVFKKIWESPIGKIIIIAVAIYTGGAVLGAWAGPSWLPTIGGAVAPTASSGMAGLGGAGFVNGVAPAVGAGALETAGASALSYSGPSLVGGNAMTGLGAGGFVGGAAQAVGGLVPSLGSPNLLAQSVASKTVDVGGTGFMNSALGRGISGFGNTLLNGGKAVAGWMQANPELTIQGMAMLGAANTPTEIDQLANLRKKQQRFAEMNMSDLGGINVDFGLGGKRNLLRPDGRPVYNAITGLMEPYVPPPA